jgi:WD40 repeat protein
MKKSYLVCLLLGLIYSSALMAEWKITEVHKLWRHNKPILSVAFSPNGSWLATGSMDKTIKIWNLKSGRLKYHFKGHKRIIRSVAFSPDNKWLASSSADRTVRIWNLSSGKLHYRLAAHPSSVWSVGFSSDSAWLASASKDKTIKTWNIETKKLQHILAGHKDGVATVAYSPNSHILASGGIGGMVKLWNLKTGQLEDTLSKHKDEIWSVAFSPDGKLLATASKDKTIKIWQTKSYHLLKSLKAHRNGVSSVVFSPDSEWIISTSIDNSVKFWNVADGHLEHTIFGGNNNDWLWSIAISPDAKWLAAGGASRAVKLWQLQLHDAFKSIPNELLCQSALSKTWINNPRSFNKISQAYKREQKRCDTKLKKLRATEKSLNKLQQQVQTMQTNASKNQTALKAKREKFEQAHSLDVKVSAKKQSQAYNLYHKALRNYNKSQQGLGKYEQSITAAEARIRTERKKMRPYVRKLDVLHRELAAARFKIFKSEIERKKQVQVKKTFACKTTMTIKDCQKESILASKRQAVVKGTNILIDNISWSKLFPNISKDKKSKLIEQMRKNVTVTLLSSKILDKGFNKQYSVFTKIRATVKGKVSTRSRGLFLE